MAKVHGKCSISLAIKEIQIKMQITFYPRMTIIKNFKTTNTGEVLGEKEVFIVVINVS